MSDFTLTPSSETSAKKLMVSLDEAQAQQLQLIGNFSHEMRTPLSLVYGYMQSIHRRNENLTDLQKNALEIAMFEMKHTIQLLQESLDLARLDCHAICLRRESVPLHGLISEAIAFSPQVKSREITVESEESNILVLADAARLQQVLLRLIDNAVKYSDTAITIRLEKSGDYVAISICDRGCGIDLQDQLNIFNPFYRVDRSRNRDTGGAGLGLAIAKVLVEGMGGTLNVYSQLGEGSIFKIILKSLVSSA
ncbi:cell wall metabolism sensor histidine kinase WalK [Pseudanabaena sp. lw0831]|uniref:sensor histidine kinase n=1 Tax=Pseudanabaena sp. lw0831 TaxID=1357935 RepID=UPI00191533F3|nr:HAMP domain-containing sensor histidine kinase [Pseudanabaena sp. lw0831]